MEQLDGNQDLIAGLCIVEQDDRLQVIAERNAPAVEVNDLWHGSVRVCNEVEPDSRTGEVVAVQCFWNLDGAAIPDCVGGGFAGRLDELPCAVVERGGFAVLDIAGGKSPFLGGELAGGREGLEHTLCGR